MSIRQLTTRAVAALLVVSAVAGAQRSTDSRWSAWTGCWQATIMRTDPSQGVVCVTPTAGSAVEIAMVDSNKIVARDTIDASGQRRPFASQGCTGWRTGEWSRDGRRVYLKSEVTCGGGLVRTSSGIIGMNGDGDWIHVENARSGDNSAVRSVRYAQAGSWLAAELPSELIPTLTAGNVQRNDARMLASTDIKSKDVIEASKAVDTAVVQAWLVERGQEFDLDAKELIALADAGVSGSVIDVMVGVSFPSHFSLAGNSPKTREADSLRATQTRAPYGRAYGRTSCSSMWDPMWYPGYAMDPCGYSYRYGIYSYGYGDFDPYYSSYGYGPRYGGGGFYYPSTVVIVEKPELPHGTAVKGQGYTRGRASGSDGDDTSPVPPSGSSRSGASARGAASGSSAGSSGTSSKGSSSGSSSGSSTGRTAQKKGGGN